ILIEDGTIKEIGKVNYIDEENLTQIDCSHKFALPGLFECHGHLAWVTTLEDKVKKQTLKEFVVKGITQVRDVAGPVKILKRLKDDISNGEFLGPDIFYSGPMLEKSPLTWEANNKFLPGITVAINSKQDAKNIVEEISNEGASLVKTFGKFDLDVFKYLLDEAKEHNLPVTHDPGPTFFHSVPMDRGIDLGIRCFEHGKSPWYVVLKDDLKSEHDSLIDADPKAKEAFITKVMALGIESISLTKLQQLIDKMLDHDVYFCPTLYPFKYLANHPEEYSKDEPDKFKKRFEIMYKTGRVFTEEIIKQSAKILVGHDGYNPEFTFNEIELLKELGLSESEIIKGATIYPALWLGIADQIGSISPNKKANILILNKNPLEDIQNIRTTHAVLQNGKVVFQEQNI
ncbi:MAG: amidohydrolase family protein, partial [candidate division Zixibacteria bacterium]|nr:amidohydrolase family protein [candidate division Zixibacteria bacterium]